MLALNSIAVFDIFTLTAPFLGFHYACFLVHVFSILNWLCASLFSAIFILQSNV